MKESEMIKVANAITREEEKIMFQNKLRHIHNF